MLSHSDLPISHIAEFLGFKSQSHFTRAFRQHVAETPSDYRRRGRQQPNADPNTASNFLTTT